MPKIKSQHTDVVWARIDSVVSLILDNDSYLQTKRKEALAKIVSKKFNITKRSAERYISEAKKKIREISKEDARNSFERAMRDREFLFLKAKGVKDDKGHYIIEPDFKLALEVVKDRDKIKGLYTEKTESEVTVKNIDLSKFTEHGLERLKRGDTIEDVLIDPKSIKA